MKFRPEFSIGDIGIFVTIVRHVNLEFHQECFLNEWNISIVRWTRFINYLPLRILFQGHGNKVLRNTLSLYLASLIVINFLQYHLRLNWRFMMLLSVHLNLRWVFFFPIVDIWEMSTWACLPSSPFLQNHCMQSIKCILQSCFIY